jgi:hypothetical protein
MPVAMPETELLESDAVRMVALETLLVACVDVDR